MSMAPRAYYLPSTPRSSRKRGSPDHGGRDWSSRGLHEPPRNDSHYSPRRRRRQRRWRRELLKDEDRYYRPLYPDRKAYWDPVRASESASNNSSNASRHVEPSYASLSVHGRDGEGKYSTRLGYIPKIVSPNTSKPTFTKIMNGVYDLKESPLSLGRKLATIPATSFSNDQSHYNPFRTGSSSSQSGAISSTSSTGCGKRLASFQLGPSSPKHIKTEPSSPAPLGSLPAFEPSGLMPQLNQMDSITVGFGAPQGSIPTAIEDFQAKLMQMINLNVKQSKELADIASRYLDPDAILHPPPLVSKPDRLSSQPFTYRRFSESGPQIATIPGGGDSPDPPKDNQIPFRGHMIDHLDVKSPNEKGDVDMDRSETRTPERATSTELRSGDTVEASANDGAASSPEHIPAERNYGRPTYFAWPAFDFPASPALSNMDSPPRYSSPTSPLAFSRTSSIALASGGNEPTCGQDSTRIEGYSGINSSIQRRCTCQNRHADQPRFMDQEGPQLNLASRPLESTSPPCCDRSADAGRSVDVSSRSQHGDIQGVTHGRDRGLSRSPPHSGTRTTPQQADDDSTVGDSMEQLRLNESDGDSSPRGFNKFINERLRKMLENACPHPKISRDGVKLRVPFAPPSSPIRYCKACGHELPPVDADYA
ncbi:hypothetical protein AJ80_05279 [Polytolypa hystricis UAMH7299]|uniref:Uncharacterized protein n=1 Tax=Polytolypa hystricis (strain UAMH7299) TaxID=1447883 RepID=A0A2B7Y442_POLH7|nr:hypothetical protein AJ80_05279 [Polytolypa hystricis UAMH7299]